MDFLRTRIDFRRSITSYSKVQWAISAIIRNRSFLAKTKPAGCYLDLGCGPNTSSAFCNLDYNWHPGVDICWDVTRGLPFTDKFIGGIYTEHMLEHLPFQDALKVLVECRRVLCGGGTLRIVVPDGESYLSKYTENAMGHYVDMPNAGDIQSKYPFETPMINVNFVFREHGHEFIWDYETIRLALLRCGFQHVEKRAFGKGADPMLIRDSPSRREESMYVEAH